LRQRLVGGERRAGEDEIRAGGGKGDIRRGEVGERVLRRDQPRRRSDQGGERRLVARGGDRRPDEVEIERGEQTPFILDP
jgi:hypothetical protein